jgi:O-antigen/teichoic acid export membrane protein
MENVLIQAGIIAILYLIVKFGEMRLVLKENKPIKLLLRDSIIVYISAFLGLYVIDQFMLQGETSKAIPKAFTDNPSF